jgi:hypothetical protein
MDYKNNLIGVQGSFCEFEEFSVMILTLTRTAG